MKYITFVVPCYNSQEYMRRCIDSLLPGGEDVEIIIVDDGSTDETGNIADYYEAIYHNIVKVVHKENGGHGSGVNMGLQLAAGMYFKVVDSDDWLEPEAYEKFLQKIKEFCDKEKADDENIVENSHNLPDLLITNYVYNHLDEGTRHVMHYRNVFPSYQVSSWNEIGRFRPSQYLIMHALVYRTAVLQRSGVVLPEHTFYVDNIFAYQPLPWVESIYYMDVDLYEYYLGRGDQSVNEHVLMSRIDQQLKVTKIVFECVDLEEVKERYPRLAQYMCRNISVMMAISSIHLLLINTKEAYRKRKNMWETVRKQDRMIYYKLKYTTLSGLTYLPGKLGSILTIQGYRAARRIYQFQ
ncbi:MAG: glycosyltransferase [Lachnospiraceae bacterium]|nr:glycosyltransferase [Lachnospiraceae bacterium]